MFIEQSVEGSRCVERELKDVHDYYNYSRCISFRCDVLCLICYFIVPARASISSDRPCAARTASTLVHPLPEAVFVEDVPALQFHAL